MDRPTILRALAEQGAIPVFHHEDAATAIAVIEACAAGGMRCIEFTLRAAMAIDTFTAVARHFAQSDPSVLLGVGSVIDAPTAAEVLNRGARFVVSPLLNPEVARICNRRMVAYIPGCGTPTEIGQAHELGCEVVKLFPGAAAGGPGFVRDLLGPMPWTRIMPTGGVEPTEASMRPWFEAGVVACGLGSKLLPPALIAAGDFAGVERRVRETLAIVQGIRHG